MVTSPAHLVDLVATEGWTGADKVFFGVLDAVASIPDSAYGAVYHSIYYPERSNADLARDFTAATQNVHAAIGLAGGVATLTNGAVGAGNTIGRGLANAAKGEGLALQAGTAGSMALSIEGAIAGVRTVDSAIAGGLTMMMAGNAGNPSESDNITDAEVEREYNKMYTEYRQRLQAEIEATNRYLGHYSGTFPGGSEVSISKGIPNHELFGLSKEEAKHRIRIRMAKIRKSARRQSPPIEIHHEPSIGLNT